MFGNDTSSTETKAFGIQDQMTANSQQAVPVAYVAGTRKIAVKWISEIYNLYTKTNNTSTGKKS